MAENPFALVLGGSGFVGSNLCRAMQESNWIVSAPRRETADVTSLNSLTGLMCYLRPDVVVNLAAFVGGIGLNREQPADMIYRNLQMSMNVVEACRIAKVGKLVYLGTVCSYPHTPPRIPFHEDDLWLGRPESTNEPYGVAKKTIGLMLDAYKRQYGMKSAYLMPTNMYGPFDNFSDKGSHVIPAMIARFLRAKWEGARSVLNWGDGSASRDFLYVADCCSAIMSAAELIDDPEPINVGSGVEWTMRDLAAKIAEIVGYDGEIEWDATKPNGQPRRCLDVTRCRERLGFVPSTSFEAGLQMTIEWYLASGDKSS